MKAMWKQIGGWAVAVCLLLGVTACGGTVSDKSDGGAATAATTAAPTDAAALYAAAAAKTDALTDQAYTFSFIYGIKGDGLSMDVSMRGDIRMTQEDGQTAAAMVMTGKILGQETEYTMYIRDGVLYMADGTDRYYQTISPEEIHEQLGEMSMPDIQKDMFDNTATVTQENGKQVISASLQGDKVMSMLRENNELFDGMLEEGDSTSLNFDNAKLKTVLTADGYIESCTLDMTMTVTYETTDMKVTMTITMDMVNPGQKVTIEWPDFSDYQEMSSDDESAVVMAVLDTLYDEEGNPVADYEAEYLLLCEEYGKETVDAVLASLMGE